MINLKLDERDVVTFLHSFRYIGEMEEVDLKGDVSLRYAIANMVGDIRSQVSENIESSTDSALRTRIDMRSLLIDLYKDWEADRDCDPDIKPAAQVIHDLLGKYDMGTYYDSTTVSKGPVAAIDALEQALADKDAEFASDHVEFMNEEDALETELEYSWSEYEITLCAYTDKEIDTLALDSLVETIIQQRNSWASDKASNSSAMEI